MDSPRFSRDVLAQMRLSQLRELARRLGVGRYSSMLRLDLLVAIQGRAPRAEFSELTESTEFKESTQPVAPPVAPSAVPSVEKAVVPAVAPSVVPSVQKADLPTVSDPARAVSSLPLIYGERTAEVQESVAEVPTWVSFQPLDSQWAHVRWGILAADRERAQAGGGQQLALRITDETDRQSHDGRPHTLQEVLVEAHSQEWHVPVPLGDRDYRVELGYRTSTGGWISLAISSVARMPADFELSSAFVPFSIVEAQPEESSWEPALATPGQHERLYQQSSTGGGRRRLGSEAFHEQGASLHGAPGGHLSGAGLWASGREASGAGLAPRQRSFWLVADAELIVYGATDPAATLTVGSEKHALTSDGTFSLHMAFPDGDQTYPIEALAADGEQKRSITLDFRRTTPHAHVNKRETAVSEWF